LGRHQDPVPNLRDLLEGTGVHVFEIPVEQSEFAGFSWWHPAYGPCIMVNARDALGRRNFTMAHEYAHLIAKSGPSLCDLSLVTGPERFADRFAAALLVPESDLRAQWERRGYCGSGLTLGQVDALARRYGCSAEAIARRLRELELIAKATRDRILDETHKRLIYRRRGKAPPWTKRLGAHYISLASKAYSTGRISVGKLAECLGISVAEAAQISRTR
jgi:Zn-dependent peptidase ImmA (M78 family)